MRTQQSRDSTPVKGILKPAGKETQLSSTDLYFDHRVLSSISEADRSVDSSADLIQYAKRVLETDNRDENSPPMSFQEWVQFLNFYNQPKREPFYFYKKKSTTSLWG